MTSFGWKRKIKVPSKPDDLESAFHESEQILEPELDPDFDWIVEAKKRKVEALEDNKIRFDRWDEALQINSEDAPLLEMKAQALIQVHEWIPAIEFAEKTVAAERTWWVGYQTLGRAQLGLGEVRLALRNFKIALHLNPEETELWEEDIAWANHLIAKSLEKRDPEEETPERIKPDSVPRVQLRTALQHDGYSSPSRDSSSEHSTAPEH